MFISNNIKFYKKINLYKIETQKNYKKFVETAKTIEEAKMKLEKLKNSHRAKPEQEEIKIIPCRIYMGKCTVEI
jgi:hypothetical protein